MMKATNHPLPAAAMPSPPTSTDRNMRTDDASTDNTVFHEQGAEQHGLKLSAAEREGKRRREAMKATNHPLPAAAMPSPPTSTDRNMRTDDASTDNTVFHEQGAEQHGLKLSAAEREGKRRREHDCPDVKFNAKRRRPLQDINGNGDPSLSSEKKPGRRLKAEYTASPRAKQILEQFASSEFLRNASSHLLNTLIPDIDKATGENKDHIEFLYRKIEDDHKVLDRLLHQYEFHNMVHHLSELSAEQEREGILMERGWMDNTVAKFVAQGKLAEDKNQNMFVLKGCRGEEDDEDLVGNESRRSLFGVRGDPWLLMPNPNKTSRYTGVRVTRNDVFDKNSKEDRLSSQIIGCEYNRVTGYNASNAAQFCAAQCRAFYGEKLGELWMMALYPERTMNRNCFYCLNSITTRSYHEAGVLRVDRDAIENGWAGYYNNWSETVHRAIGASDEQLLTLEPRKKGESYSPDAYFHKYYTMLYNYYVNEGKPDEIWVVDPSKCEDYDEKKKSSKMYVYWSNLYGLTSQPKIQLQQWQQENLAAIWIRPDDVELVKEAQTKRRRDQQIAKMQARKNNISKRK